MIDLTRCRLCQSPALAEIGQAEDYLTGHLFHLKKCNHCAAVMTSPFPVEPSELQPYYGDAYYGQPVKKFRGPAGDLFHHLKSGRARKIGRLIRPGKVLDIGCGNGFLLACLQQMGWQCCGTEFSETLVEHIRRREPGIQVFSRDPWELPESLGRFDLIVLWHSLEHMREPCRALDWVGGHLKPGGTIVLAFPNFTSLQARAGGSRWFHLDVPRHLFHFSSHNLLQWLEAHGFAVTRENHFVAEQNLYGWAQTIQNRMGLGFNLLYRRLAGGPPRRRAAGETIRGLLAALSLPAVLVAAGFLFCFEGALRRGGTVELWARKEAP